MVDELRRAFTGAFAHGFENARLGDPAEIIADRWPPPSLHHVEPGRPCQPVGLGEAQLQGLLADTGAAIGVGPLIERVHPVADAMRKKRHATFLVQFGQPVPERGVVSRDAAIPLRVAIINGLGRCALAEVLCLGGEVDMPNLSLERTICRAMVEGVGDKFVQERRHCDRRVLCDRVAQSQRAVGRQFGHQALGQRLDAVVLFILALEGLSAHGDDGRLYTMRQ